MQCWRGAYQTPGLLCMFAFFRAEPLHLKRAMSSFLAVDSVQVIAYRFVSNWRLKLACKYPFKSNQNKSNQKVPNKNTPCCIEEASHCCAALPGLRSQREGGLLPTLGWPCSCTKNKTRTRQRQRAHAWCQAIFASRCKVVFALSIIWLTFGEATVMISHMDLLRHDACNIGFCFG